MNNGAELFDQQVAECTDQAGQLDTERLIRVLRTTYSEMRRERVRTERVIRIMGEEVEELTRDLENKIEARTLEAVELRERFDLALDNISQGILLVGPNGGLVDSNRVALDLLGLRPEELNGRMSFRALMARLSEAGEFASAPEGQAKIWLEQEIHEQPPHYTRVRPNGHHIEICTTQLPDGSSVRTYTDVTERYHHEQALIAAEREYRTLFDNAEAGIFRAGLDNTLIRANPALARIHGYTDEKTYLAAIDQHGSFDWYVDPGHGHELRERIMQSGRVEDFVSEIYRQKTREKIWVSQTVWLVRDANGEPLCFEGMVINSSERVQAEQRILELSRNDPLTGLSNRRTFMQLLAQKIRANSARKIAPTVLYLDLDRFKFVNDTLGHAMGDLLLQAVVRRLELLMDDGCLLARLGGDEFAIMTPDTNQSRIMAMAERMIAGIGRPFVLRGLRAAIGLTIGIAFGGDSKVDPDELLKMADIALYAAKAEGKGRALAFKEHMAEHALRRQVVEQALRDAAKRGEFSLFYQPIVDARTGTVLCHEALMRWHCDTLGTVNPVEFIPIAEETGLIHLLGQWALMTACADAVRYFPNERIAVNVSAVQLRSPQFKSFVLDALIASGLPPAKLEIEITENVLISDDKLVLDVLRELRNQGIRVVLDDFGTGYSSMVYLQKFPFDKIKIDRTFISSASAGNTNAAIIRATIALAKELNIELVAEGIETHAQAEALIRAGCHMHQGYLYGPPEMIEQSARRGTEAPLAVLVPPLNQGDKARLAG